MSDQIVAVALPWHDGPRAALVGTATPIHADAVLKPCTDCGQVLAVGPATMLALAADTAIALCCPTCGVGRCREAGLVIEVNLSRCGPLH